MELSPWSAGAAALSLFYLAVLGTFVLGVARLRVRGEKDRVAPDGAWPRATKKKQKNNQITRLFR